jgi:hypothetical protein
MTCRMSVWLSIYHWVSLMSLLDDMAGIHSDICLNYNLFSFFKRFENVLLRYLFWFTDYVISYSGYCMHFQLEVYK